MKCKDCKYKTTNNGYSTDGFDYMEDWICTKSNRVIQGAVEWHEEKKIEAPKWCPIDIVNIRDSKLNIILNEEI